VWQAPHLLWGTAPNWGSLAAYYATVSEGALAGADLAPLARSIVAPGDYAVTQARKLTSYVREHVRMCPPYGDGEKNANRTSLSAPYQASRGPSAAIDRAERRGHGSPERRRG
jgi:hypothetical protein